MMKLTQKHTCFGCKALYWDKGEGLCRLGYETAKMIGTEREIVPVEPCPKPMTARAMGTAKHKDIAQLSFTLSEIELLEWGMRLLRYNSLEAFNENKKNIPVADAIIKRLQEILRERKF